MNIDKLLSHPFPLRPLRPCYRVSRPCADETLSPYWISLESNISAGPARNVRVAETQGTLGEIKIQVEQYA